MDKSEAVQLAKEINKTTARLRVHNLLNFEDGSFAVEVRDTEQNKKFIIYNEKDWVIWLAKAGIKPTDLGRK